MHQYRQECILRRQILEKRQEDLEFIKKVMGFSLIKAHSIRTETDKDKLLFEDDLMGDLEDSSRKRSFSMDGIYMHESDKPCV